MSDSPPPTWDDWREKLRELRELSGMTQRRLATVSRLSKSTVGALETGISPPKRTHAIALDEALSSLGTLTTLWDDVSGKARRIPQWWAKPLELEQKAKQILEYEPSAVPGLLQTEEYAQALFEEGVLIQVGPNQIANEVTIRTSRIETVSADLRFILTERAMLSHPSGNPSVVTGQLGHIANLMEKGAIRLQVLPDTATPLGAFDSFRVVVLNPQQSVAYMEYALGGEVRSDAESIHELASLFGRLSSESLSVSMSLEWIRRTISQWNGGAPQVTPKQTEGTASKSQDQRTA